MKTKNLLIAVLLLIGTVKMYATDLCVAENGTGGCYSTITDAINAASNGDRIIINPKAGNAPYAENLTITKTLQFLCNVEGGQYTVSGNITITPAVNRVIVIIGMNNLLGNVTTTGASPVGVRCKVSLMNCNFGNGYIDFDYDNFDITIASCVFSDSYIQIRYGRIIGNDITSITNSTWQAAYHCSVYVGTDATATNDSIVIVGNKVNNNLSTAWTYPCAIYVTTTNQFDYIENNLVILQGGSYPAGIFVSSAKNSTVGRNSIINNTITAPTSNVNYGAIQVYNNPINAYFDVLNNLILAQSGSGVGVSAANGPINVSYNFMNNPLVFIGVTDDGTNNLSSNTTLDVNNRPNSGSDAINGGSPDEAYYDINLTRNDAGAFGGSFTLDNFYPVTGAARVYYVRAPRKVTLGSTLNVKGDAFDR